jgi:hypothetical protein
MSSEKERILPAVDVLMDKAEECFDAAHAQHAKADQQSAMADSQHDQADKQHRAADQQGAMAKAQHAGAERLVVLGQELVDGAVKLQGEIDMMRGPSFSQPAPTSRLKGSTPN